MTSTLLTPPSPQKILRRRLNQVAQASLDLAALAAAFVLAFYARFDWAPPPDMEQRCWILLPFVVTLEYVVLRALGVQRFSWRYVGLREGTRLFFAISLSTGILLLTRLGLAPLLRPSGLSILVPLGVIFINFPVAFLFTAGMRVTRRLWGERALISSRRTSQDTALPTLLFGAGQAGLLVAKELQNRPDLGIRAVAFVDDDILKQGMVLHGVPVSGTSATLPEVIKKTRARQVLIAVAEPSGALVRRVTQLCERSGVGVKIVPGLYELMNGSVNLSRIRNVNIEDLLRREPVILTEDSVNHLLSSQVIAVTGAGGSIGSELCRQICEFNPERIVLFERAENALFLIHRELTAQYPGLEIVPCVGDVGDAARVSEVFKKHRPHTVFHAAAHKHVPMMEWNVGEAIKNNLLGTKTVASAAMEHGAERFVLVSTDKAVNPSSVMGATKRAAEVYTQGLLQGSNTKFVAVRFGNVLGSAGSVVPIFQDQISKGGPVTVTDPEMTRYFMTIPEACQLMLQAASMGEGGEIFVLDMGEPVKIVDLARDLIKLSGLRPDEDIPIHFTGVRPGEKLFEELITDEERTVKTSHPKVLIGRVKGLDLQEANLALEKIIAKLTAEGDEQELREALKLLVPEFVPPPKRPATPPSARAPAARTSAQPTVAALQPISAKA